MSQDGVPHSMRTMLNSLCSGVDANAHNISCSRHVHCCERATYYAEDWWDQFENGTLFECLFDATENSETLTVAHVGVANIDNARNGNPRRFCEVWMSTNTINFDHPQNDQEYESSIRKSCSAVSEQPSGSGQSTSSYTKTKTRVLDHRFSILFVPFDTY